MCCFFFFSSVLDYSKLQIKTKNSPFFTTGSFREVLKTNPCLELTENAVVLTSRALTEVAPRYTPSSPPANPRSERESPVSREAWAGVSCHSTPWAELVPAPGPGALARKGATLWPLGFSRPFLEDHTRFLFGCARSRLLPGLSWKKDGGCRAAGFGPAHEFEWLS